MREYRALRAVLSLGHSERLARREGSMRAPRPEGNRVRMSGVVTGVGVQTND